MRIGALFVETTHSREKHIKMRTGAFSIKSIHSRIRRIFRSKFRSKVLLVEFVFQTCIKQLNKTELLR